jgi:hypothetical protein
MYVSKTLSYSNFKFKNLITKILFWKLYWVYSEEDAVPSVLPQAMSKYYSIKDDTQAINQVNIYFKLHT